MRVFSNLATSLDGKIADRAQPRKLLGTALDWKRVLLLRARADVVVCGAETLRTHPVSLRAQVKKGQRQPATAVITRSGRLPASNAPFWQDPEIVRFVFTTRAGFKAAQALAQERAFVVVAGEEEVDLVKVLQRLQASGLEQILVEGGGELLRAFLAQKLLQEMHLTLCPWLLGGRENPGLVGGAQALLPWSKLRLLKVEKVKDELYLRYRVIGSRAILK